MLPPTSVGIPAVFKMCATSEVVVVFPFEPVIATSLPRRNRHASSISLHTGMPRLRASASAGKICRHARAHHDQILLEKRRRRVPPEFELHAGRAQPRRRLAEFASALFIRRRHRRAISRARKATSPRPCARAPPPARAFPQNRTPVSPGPHSVPYLNFKVVSENSANTSARIQNRTMIFDSLQPISSK